MCDSEVNSSWFFPEQNLDYYNYHYQPSTLNQVSGAMDWPSGGLTLNDVKGTVYENFMIYSKNDINLRLLKQFDYDTVSRPGPNGRPQNVYICNYDGCKKEFYRTCNLLDHMRMHAGIKPHV